MQTALTEFKIDNSTAVVSFIELHIEIISFQLCYDHNIKLYYGFYLFSWKARCASSSFDKPDI